MTDIKTEKILNIYDAGGNFQGVIIPAGLWLKYEPLLRDVLPKQQQDAGDDLAGFDELMQSWSFQYPYSPAVKCPSCGAETPDWRNDPKKPFCLTNANIGGLMVFHCNACGTTIRQKYFRRHMAVEYSCPDK